jgi:soluble cytochrome b562
LSLSISKPRHLKKLTTKHQHQPITSSYPPPSAAPILEDSPAIAEWREKQALQIEQRDKISADKREGTINEARKAIDDFYDSYNDKKEKNIAATRREEKEFLDGRADTTAGGTSWERIGKLVDLSGKGTKGGASGTGKERFREMLLSLRKDETAPGVGGV